jgi:hypothetical protein
VIVCNRRGESQRGNKGDRSDAEQLADLLRHGALRAVYHDSGQRAALKELARTYQNLVQDSTRVMLRLKALFRARGIVCCIALFGGILLHRPSFVRFPPSTGHGDRICSASAIDRRFACLITSLGTHSGKGIRPDRCAPVGVCSFQTLASCSFRNREASFTTAGHNRRWM